MRSVSRKSLVVAVFTLAWAATAMLKNQSDHWETNLDGSWTLGLVAMLQQGLVSGRDFHFTYGPLAQLLHWSGTLVSQTHTAFDSFPISNLICDVFSGIVVAVILMLSKRVTALNAAFVYLSLALLNVDINFRLALLILCCVMAYRTVVASGFTQVNWAVATAMVCFLTQLSTPEAGIYGVFTMLAMTVIYSLKMAAPRRGAKLFAIFLTVYAAANVVISAAFRLSSPTYESLFAYQKYAMATMSGYLNGMGLPWEMAGWPTIVLLAVASFVVVLAAYEYFKRDFAEAALLITITTGSLFSLRSATVRSDLGHITYAFTPMIFAFLIAGPGALVKQATRRSRQYAGQVLYLIVLGMLFIAWPFTSFATFRGVRQIITGEVSLPEVWKQYRTRNISPNALLPAELLEDVRRAPMGPMLPFPYDDYIPILLQRPLIAPVLQSYSAGTLSLQDFYLRELQRFGREGFDVVYSVDDVSAFAIDGVQAVTRTPGVFEYLYNNFELTADRSGAGIYLLRPAGLARQDNSRNLSFQILRENRNTGTVHLSSPVACGMVKLEMRVDYPLARVVLRPNPILITFGDGERTIQTSYLRPLVTGQYFSTYVSTMRPKNFHLIFGSGTVPVEPWDSLRFNIPRTDQLGVNPSRVEVKAIDCLDPNRFVVNDEPMDVVDNGFERFTSLLGKETITGYIKLAPTTGETPRLFIRLGHFSPLWNVTKAVSTQLTRKVSADLQYPIDVHAVGLAVVNPGPNRNTITLDVTDQSGHQRGQTKVHLNPGQHVSRLVSEIIPSAASGMVLKAHSLEPFGILLLEISPTVVRMLPMNNIEPEPSDSLFPHFAIGGGWGTEIVLFNPSDGIGTGVVQLRSSENRLLFELPYTIEGKKAITLFPWKLSG